MRMGPQHRLLKCSSGTTSSSQTKMTVKQVQLHFRILRRLSMAVTNEASPVYKDSALYFFERNEDLWGRKGKEVLLQESSKYLDCFQSALPSLSDLRDAAEALHIMNLRGCTPKLAGRNVAEHARALTMYNQLPTAVVAKFPAHKALVQDFLSTSAFHEKFPYGMTVDGVEVKEHPIFPDFGYESLERLVQEVLAPTLSGKRHNNLMNATNPNQIGFVRMISPDLEHLYAPQTAQRRAVPTSAAGELVDSR